MWVLSPPNSISQGIPPKNGRIPCFFIVKKQGSPTKKNKEKKTGKLQKKQGKKNKEKKKNNFKPVVAGFLGRRCMQVQCTFLLRLVPCIMKFCCKTCKRLLQLEIVSSAMVVGVHACASNIVAQESSRSRAAGLGAQLLGRIWDMHALTQA